MDLVLRVGDFVKEVISHVRERKEIILAVIAVGKKTEKSNFGQAKKRYGYPNYSYRNLNPGGYIWGF